MYDSFTVAASVAETLVFYIRVGWNSNNQKKIDITFYVVMTCCKI